MTNLIADCKFNFILVTALLAGIVGGQMSANAGEIENIPKRIKSDIQRDKTSKPDQIIEFTGVKKGQQILDLFGGGGYYSELFANRVGKNGSVTLQNNQAYMPFIGVELEVRLADDRLKNVVKLMSEAKDLKLGENKYDLVVLVLGYHDFFYTQDKWEVPANVVMPQVVKSLKKGGKFLVIDHNAVKDSKFKFAHDLHRIEDTFAKQDIENRGLTFVKESNILRNSADPLSIKVFDPKIRRNTDRFVYLFKKQ